MRHTLLYFSLVLSLAVWAVPASYAQDKSSKTPNAKKLSRAEKKALKKQGKEAEDDKDKEKKKADKRALAKAMKDVDYVFHLAAMIGGPESMQKPLDCVDINVNGTLMVLEEAANAGVKKLCYASSAAVYGNSCDSIRREDMCADPDSIYAVTKLDGTGRGGMAVALHEEFDLPTFYVGLGEQPGELQLFDPVFYADALFEVNA